MFYAYFHLSTFIDTYFVNKYSCNSYFCVERIVSRGVTNLQIYRMYHSDQHCKLLYMIYLETQKEGFGKYL